MKACYHCELCKHDVSLTLVESELYEIRRKFDAAMVLLVTGRQKGIVIPTANEWYGLGLLERDDELKRRKGKNG